MFSMEPAPDLFVVDDPGNRGQPAERRRALLQMTHIVLVASLEQCRTRSRCTLRACFVTPSAARAPRPARR